MFKEYLLENVSKTLPKFLARLSRTPAVQWPNCKKFVKLAAIFLWERRLRTRLLVHEQHQGRDRSGNVD